MWIPGEGSTYLDLAKRRDTYPQEKDTAGKDQYR